MANKGQTYPPEVLQTLGSIIMNAASGNNLSNHQAGNYIKPVTISIDPAEYQELLDKPLWQLTGQQYKKLTEGAMLEALLSLKNQEPQHHLVYGIDGLAKFLGTSRSTAQRIKRSGIIDEAIAQRGRTIVVDGDMAIQLIKDKKKEGNNHE